MSHSEFMKEAVMLSAKAITEKAGGPFGCVVVKDGKIIGRGNNKVTSDNDPTAHAEVVAIRNACKALDSFQLDGCIIYTSCEPCPMCLGAIYWARPDAVYYANDREDAAAVGFDDEFIYEEIKMPISVRKIPMHALPSNEAKKVFSDWEALSNKIEY